MELIGIIDRYLPIIFAAEYFFQDYPARTQFEIAPIWPPNKSNCLFLQWNMTLNII